MRCLTLAISLGPSCSKSFAFSVSNGPYIVCSATSKVGLPPTKKTSATRGSAKCDCSCASACCASGLSAIGPNTFSNLPSARFISMRGTMLITGRLYTPGRDSIASCSTAPRSVLLGINPLTLSPTAFAAPRAGLSCRASGNPMNAAIGISSV